MTLAETTRCPNCSKAMEVGGTYCGHCGQALACWSCGAEMGVDWRFCRQCGAAGPESGEKRLRLDRPPQLTYGLGAALRVRASGPPANKAPGDRVPWGWLDLIKIVGDFLLLGIVTLMLLAVIHAVFGSRLDALLALQHAWGLSGILAGILFFVLVSYSLLAFSIYVCVLRKYQLGLRALGFRPVTISQLALAVAAWPVVITIGGAATDVMAQHFLGGHFSNPQTKDFANTGAGRGILTLLLLLICLAGIAPLVEETLFRGLLFPLLRRKLPYGAALPACAMIFTLAHGIPVLIPSLLSMGLALTLLFAHTRSLYPGMLLHAIQNAAFAIVIWSSFG